MNTHFQKFSRGSSIFMFYCIFLTKFFEFFWLGTWSAPPGRGTQGELPLCASMTDVLICKSECTEFEYECFLDWFWINPRVIYIHWFDHQTENNKEIRNCFLAFILPKASQWHLLEKELRLVKIQLLNSFFLSFP